LFRKTDLLHGIKLSIENSKEKDFSIYGAGTDLNIYFEILQKYKFTYFSNETRTFFYGHDTSLTISNNLDFYYKTVRLNFLKKRKYLLNKLYFGIIIRFKITKIFNYISPFFNKP
jgi:hypothetical protein